MRKEFICIECPNSCKLVVDIENDKVVNVTGNKCKKGETYAKCEVENPSRVLTSIVLAEGLEIKMVPVRTNKPIAKKLILTAAEEIKKIRINNSVKVGDIIVPDFLNTGADLVATREVRNE